MSEGDGGVVHIKLYFATVVLFNLNAALCTFVPMFYPSIPLYPLWFVVLSWLMAIGIDLWTVYGFALWKGVDCDFCGHTNMYKLIKPKRCSRCGKKLKRQIGR